jgi:sulfite exporter TauE/SafE
VLSLGLGLAKGLSLCLITCAPGIVPYLVSKQYDWKKCLRLGIIFNLPRIIVLTILGVILGYISFLFKEWLESEVPSVLFPTQAVAYGILGIFILVLGGYMFTTSVDTRENIKEGKKPTCDMNRSKKAFSVVEKIKNLESKPDLFFLLWGSLLSFACLGEVIVLEAGIVWSSIGVISNTLGEAMILGGFAMFLLAFGASIPLIIIATLSSSVRKYFDNVEKLESLRSIGGIILIIMGLFYTIGLVGYIISLF